MDTDYLFKLCGKGSSGSSAVERRHNLELFQNEMKTKQHLITFADTESHRTFLHYAAGL
jgi:hypothetical protein